MQNIILNTERVRKRENPPVCLRLKARFHNQSSTYNKDIFEQVNPKKSSWSPPNFRLLIFLSTNVGTILNDWAIRVGRDLPTSVQMNFWLSTESLRSRNDVVIKPVCGQRLCCFIQAGDLPASTSNLFTTMPRPSVIYFLPTIHKPDCPTELIPSFLDNVMFPLVKTLPSYIKDTKHVLHIFDQIRFSGCHKFIVFIRGRHSSSRWPRSFDVFPQ